MDKINTFNQFLASQQMNISLTNFIINFLIAGFLSFILSRVYIYCGYSLSNRRIFAKNFVLITMTTMLIITIVKSSLALSLGLVGALSIVRFRSAIKEPEELSYLFLCIAVGLGLGANQTTITVVGFFIVMLIMIIKKYFRDTEKEHNLFLSLDNIENSTVDMKKVIEILISNSKTLKLKRIDDINNMTSAAFQIHYEDYLQLEECKEQIKLLNKNINISFIDDKGYI